ncbi:hypothetical protein HK097_003931 [Rhizophlyctis rosea]|uniref:Ubiquinol-cytochrome c chaperone domain-containing protein n=1 Tax=Rhizophlyctis rosea TaxID=64517 RepID=A0AAD5S497_9FUNG|nr:hypothetical protein HK097_003931 [Rhizophlyctis rosea]
MAVLHLWILNVRLKAEGANGKDLQQEIFTHLWLDCEMKLHLAGSPDRMVGMGESSAGQISGRVWKGRKDNDEVMRRSIEEQRDKQIPYKSKQLIRLIQVKSRLNKVLQDLMSAWYGQSLAYDEGLYYEGDAILAAAIWRNVYGANQPVTATQLESLLTYVRKQLKHVEQFDRDEILNGRFKWGHVRVEDVVGKGSI